MADDTPDRSTDDALAELREVATQLTLHTAIVADLYTRRDALYVELRQATPQVTQRVIAEAAGVSEVAVVASLRKLRWKADAEPEPPPKRRRASKVS